MLLEGVYDALYVYVCVVSLWADESDEDKEVSRKPRQVRQAASKAASKQREILLGDRGSEDEEKDEDEHTYVDRESSRFLLVKQRPEQFPLSKINKAKIS